jgi:hypothetical protein
MVFIFGWNRFVSLADHFSKHGLPARNDPEQNRHYGEEKEYVNQAAGCTAHQPQQPQYDQDYGNGV